MLENACRACAINCLICHTEVKKHYLQFLDWPRPTRMKMLENACRTCAINCLICHKEVKKHSGVT